MQALCLSQIVLSARKAKCLYYSTRGQIFENKKLATHNHQNGVCACGCEGQDREEDLVPNIADK